MVPSGPQSDVRLAGENSFHEGVGLPRPTCIHKCLHRQTILRCLSIHERRNVCRHSSSIHSLACQPWSSTDTISAIGTVVAELLSPNVFGVNITTKSPSIFTSHTVPRTCLRNVSSSIGADYSNDTISSDKKTVDNNPSSVGRCHPTDRL
jgi:hypothetical protein